ncbi:MAG: site-2 protease family protein [Anaerolineales bacterium]
METVGFISLTVLLGRVLGLILGFTLHEYAHAASAVRLGGRSALADQSRLTLDPRYHMDPLGIILAIVAGFGWARPVPVNPIALYPNERRNMTIVAFAGPLTNLILGVVFAIILRLMEITSLTETFAFNGKTYAAGSNDVTDFIFEVIATAAIFNILLFFFNLLPFFPLDGWRVLLGLLPNDRSYQLAQYQQESMYVLFFLILIGFAPGLPSPIFFILSPLIDTTFEFLTGFTYAL